VRATSARPEPGSAKTRGRAFFRTGIDPKTGFYVGEDFTFVEDAKSLGFFPHVLSKAVTGHIGKFEYKQDLAKNAHPVKQRNSESEIRLVVNFRVGRQHVAPIRFQQLRIDP
jgi:hypothetical protein